MDDMKAKMAKMRAMRGNKKEMKEDKMVMEKEKKMKKPIALVRKAKTTKEMPVHLTVIEIKELMKKPKGKKAMEVFEKKKPKKK